MAPEALTVAVFMAGALLKLALLFQLWRPVRTRRGYRPRRDPDGPRVPPTGGSDVRRNGT